VIVAQETIDEIKRQNLRAAVKDFFYAEMGITDGIYPTKDKIYDFMLSKYLNISGVVNS